MIQNYGSHKVTAPMALFACAALANTVDPFHTCRFPIRTTMASACSKRHAMRTGSG
jgi:hypothetical protein